MSSNDPERERDQTDFHFAFALIAFDEFCLHKMRFIERYARLVHHRFRRLKIAFFRFSERAICRLRA